MELTIKNKKYDVKFAYIATVKSGIIRKLVGIGSEEGDAIGNIETMLQIVPEILLVGLQKNHRKEFGYNYDTLEGRDEALEKTYDLVENYIDEGNDFKDLFTGLQDEMVSNSFLAKLFATTESE